MFLVFSLLFPYFGLADALIFPKCDKTLSNEPCYAEWATKDGFFYLGIIENGLLNGRGAALYPDGSKFVGDFKSGRRHGYGVLILDEVPGYKGQLSIGVWQNDGRYGNTLYSWPNGAYFYGFDRGGIIRSDLTLADFKEWKRAFNNFAKPQRMAIQNFLGRAKLTTDRKIYNYPIDGVWGRNTFNALATYAALAKPTHFNLMNYSSAISVLEEILITGAPNTPFGYTVGNIDNPSNQQTPACPQDPTTVRYECFGSQKYKDGSVYSGIYVDGLPNGEGQLTDSQLIYIGTFKNGVLTGKGKIEKDGEIVWEGIWEELFAAMDEDKDKASETKEPSDDVASTGSGFFVTTNGHIITNYHVVEGCNFVTAKIDGDVQKVQVLATDPINDLALLSSNVVKNKSVYFRMDPISLGETIWIAGYPFGDQISSTIKLTKGIISSLSGLANDYTKFQIDAAMQPGNSGGPIIADDGSLLGVAMYKLNEDAAKESFGTTPENINFAINKQIVEMFLLANGIEVNRISESSSSIGQIAQSFTLFIGCNR